MGFVSIWRVVELEWNFWGESVRFWGGGIKKMISHLLASPRVRPRRAAPWKAIATPPPPPKTAPKNGRFRQNQKPTVSLHHRRRGGKGPEVPKYRRNCPKKSTWRCRWRCSTVVRALGRFWRVFLGGKSPISVPTAAREEARAPPPPRVLWGALGFFWGILGFFWRRGVPGAKRARKAGFWGHARVRSTKRARKVGFWVQRASPALNGLRKWDFGSGSRPQRKIGSENGVWD